MKWNSRRILSLVAVLALAALALTSAAVAGSARRHHRAVRVVRLVEHRRAVRRRIRRTFAPVLISRAAEVSAVELDPITQQFMQVTFDRGWVTQVSGGTITLQQKQNRAVWRTQAFTVPSTAVVTLNGRTSSLARIPIGAAARIESSGPVGATQAVVRVNAYSRGDAPLPATSSS
jgi:hypothetical protein